ncbi:hypothetical protein JVU11DRAFT_5586 [Chiua virens]|nr:hypothetical protein JVU11DRAFT_5586 [Chiua virens]
MAAAVNRSTWTRTGIYEKLNTSLITNTMWVTTGWNDTRKIELNGDNTIYSVAFADGEKHILCGSQEGVLWIDDAQVVKTMKVSGSVFAVAVSNDGLWIVTGEFGRVVVWDAKTHDQVHELKAHNAKKQCVSAIDVSNDSTRVVSGSDDKTVRIFSITSGEQLVGPIQHDNFVVGVKFSPGGERVAAAAVQVERHGGVRVFDARTGVNLLHIFIPIERNLSTPLAWSNDGRKLFVASPGKISCVEHLQESSTSTHVDWVIHNSDSPVSIVNNGGFIACSAGFSVSFWDPYTHKQLGDPIVHSAVIRCFTVSRDGKHLICGTRDQKIVVHELSDTFTQPRFTVDLPLMHVSDAALNPWTEGNPTRTEAVLSKEIETMGYPSHHAFANRALIRAHLKQWFGTIEDATKSLKIQPSPIGHIALALAYLGQDRREAALWEFDLAFRDCDRADNVFLLLIKSLLLYVSGRHEDAIFRVRDLIPRKDDYLTYCCTQVLASMYLDMESYEPAIETFKRASLLAPHRCSHLATISLIFGKPFDLMDIPTLRRVCETLYDAGYMKAAAEIFAKMIGKISSETRANWVTTDWVMEFSKKCVALCEHFGRLAFESTQYEEAIAQYTTALSLDPSDPAPLLIKRSRVHIVVESWDDALCDADKAIAIDPLCPWGYESKRAALHSAQWYDEAVKTYRDFLSTIESSQHPDIRRIRHNYVSPDQTNAIISEEVRKTSKTCPFVLIDITTGRLCDMKERAVDIFKQSPAYGKLLSSVTRKSDCAQIAPIVAQYFAYVTLSHVWDPDGKEPSHQDVTSTGSVWDLDVSACPMNAKLRKFCEEVRSLGHTWAWSDTCCINKEGPESVINESLMLMYQWYQNSAATLVVLADVKPGTKALTSSRWMTRCWTLQELLAPKAIRFYDCEWNPYLGDTHANHKESSVIIDELSNLMDISRGNIVTFSPDHLTVRERLRLASGRKAKEEEDEAYCLRGIFRSDIYPKYGERKDALGNLLQEIVDRSRDVTVLAWSGTPSSFNSCLPVSLAVYSQPPCTIDPIMQEDMERRIADLRLTFPEGHVLAIYDQIIGLGPLHFNNRRLRLPCIVFPIKSLARSRQNVQIYRAQVFGLGEVEFMAAESLPLTKMGDLVIVHPWIPEIRGSHDEVHRDFGHETGPVDNSYDGDEVMDVNFGSGHSVAFNGVSPAPLDKYHRALQLVARLGQPFHALILARQPCSEFKRVATENKVIVTAQVTCLKEIRVEVVEIL